MSGNDATDEGPERRTLKVRVRAEHQVRLHTLKVLTGKTMSKAVEEALAIHFEEEPVELPDRSGLHRT